MEKLKLKVIDIRNLHAGLSALDGFEKAIEKEGKTVSIREFYVFSAKTRWNISKNLRIVNQFVTTFNETRDGLIKQISGGAQIDDTNKEHFSKFLEGIKQIDNQEEEVSGLLKLSFEDLNLEKNQIPSTVLALLDKILVD